MSTDEKTLDGFAQIRTQMPAIRTLLGLWRSLRCSIGVGSSAVATDNVDFLVRFQPVLNRGCFAVRKQIDDVVRIKIDQHGSIRLAAFPGSGKGNGVAAIPSPKNRTGGFLYIRLKPFSPPVLPDAVSQRVNPDYELGDDRWGGVTPGFLPDLIPLLIAKAHDGCASL
jgi:hypothetical protein